MKKRYNRFLIELDRLSIKRMEQNKEKEKKEKKGGFTIIKITQSNCMPMKMMMVMSTLMMKKQKRETHKDLLIIRMSNQIQKL